MQAFLNDIKVKEKYLKRVRMHQKADNLVKGATGHDGKGCAVCCTLEKYEHASYETELGIPEWLARVEDTLFEGMSLKKSKTWPEEFLKAIPIGVNLEQIKSKFAIVILKHSLVSMANTKFDADKFPDVKKALEQSASAVTQMIQAHDTNDAELLRSTWSAAWAAKSAAKSAAESAAWAAAESAAAKSAAYDYYADELIRLFKDVK